MSQASPQQTSVCNSNSSKPPIARPVYRLRTKLLALLLSVVVAAVFAEVVLRCALLQLGSGLLVYLHSDLKASYPDVQARIREHLPYFNLRQEDPVTGWTFKSGMHCQSTNEDQQPYDIKATQEGYFTPDCPAENDRQLIVLGDSFASTFYVPRPIAFVMRDELKAPVYNLSVHGWGPESYRAAYTQRGAARNHDVVVVFSFLNDITDVDNWNRWKAGRTDESFLTWIQRTSPDTSQVNSGRNWFDRHSVAWNCLKAVGTSASRKAPTAGTMPIGTANSARQEQFTDTKGQLFSLQSIPDCAFTQFEPPMFQPGGSYFSYMDAYFASLERLRDEINASGARMVLVWIPAKERIYMPLLPAERSAAWIANKSGKIDGIETVLHDFAEEAGITLLDLTDELSRRAKQGEKLYFTIDGHLNDRGNVVVGEHVASFLKKLPEDGPRPTPTEQRRLRVRPGVIDTRLADRDANYRDHCVQHDGGVWRLHGKPAGKYSYLLTWPASELQPTRLVVKGSCNMGGITIGAVRDEKWYVQQNVTNSGEFAVMLTISEPGKYGVIVAGYLPDALDHLDVTISEIGLSSGRRDDAITVNSKKSQ